MRQLLTLWWKSAVISPCALTKVWQEGLDASRYSRQTSIFPTILRHSHGPFRRGLNVSRDKHAEVGGDQAVYNSAEGCRWTMFAERAAEEDRGVNLKGSGRQTAADRANSPIYRRPSRRHGRSCGPNVSDFGSKSGNIGTFGADTSPTVCHVPQKANGRNAGSVTTKDRRPARPCHVAS